MTAIGEQDPLAGAVEVVGERWTLLILRDIFAGVRGFDDLHTRLGITRAVLADRLRALVDDGLLDRVRSSDHPSHYDYYLTPKGRDLEPALTALRLWGDQHATSPRPPRRNPPGGGCAVPAS